MPLSDLIQLMPPPAIPSFPPTEKDWEEAEERLGTPLPSDYKAFVSLYGTGFIGGFLCVLNPILPHLSCFNLIEWTDYLLKNLRELRHSFPKPDDYGIALYPEPGGLIPCGLTVNSDSLYWVTTGPADEWSLLLWEVRSTNREAYAITLTEFIEDLLKGNIKSSLFIGTNPDPWTTFEAIRPKDTRS